MCCGNSWLFTEVIAIERLFQIPRIVNTLFYSRLNEMAGQICSRDKEAEALWPDLEEEWKMQRSDAIAIRDVPGLGDEIGLFATDDIPGSKAGPDFLLLKPSLPKRF